MNLHQYPRPTNDTGIGIHWSPGYAASIGLGKIRDYWIPEMKALGIKWVKVANHDGAKEFVALLLAEGFMPIVRIFRGRSNPGRLTLRELVEVDSLTRLGVRYIEFNNEPDRDTEWKGGRVPVNAIDIVVEDVIADLEALMTRGAMPAIPAVSSGSSWDLIGKIVEKGRKDILDGPVWQAIHNYARNRPLDYPYDIGNQEGTPYTDRFYRTIADEPSGFDAWHGRTLNEINRLRTEHANPRATIGDEHGCWLAYQYFHERHLHHIGRSIPILATENGYLLSENTDPRYPATTPNLHMAQTLEACRIMMGTSERFKPAPDYYFCTAFSVIANKQLGSQANWWENQAWYSDKWPNGALPIVQALRSEPKVLRKWQGNELGKRTNIRGTVLHTTTLNPTDARTIILEQNGSETARADLDASNRYTFPDIAAGTYTIRVDGTDLIESITIAAAQDETLSNETVLDLDMSKLDRGSAQSSLTGSVRGGSEAIVMLLHTEDGTEWVTTAAEDGSFRFVELPAGAYNVRVYPRGSRIQDLALDGEQSREITLAKEGWGHTVEQIEQTPQDDKTARSAVPRKGKRVIRCAVQGYKELSVQAFAVGENDTWHSRVEKTGSDPQYGEFACEIDLSPHPDPARTQQYTVRVDGIADANGTPIVISANVTHAAGKIPFVTFSHFDATGPQSASHSTISGTIRGDFLSVLDVENGKRGGDSSLPNRALPVVVLRDGQAREQRQRVSAAGEYAFTDLSAGLYNLFVEDGPDAALAQDASGGSHLSRDALSRDDLALDGTNQLTIDLTLPSAADPLHPELGRRAEATVSRSVIAGVAPGAVGATARLADTLGNEFVRIVASDERVRFSGLPPGTYTLTVEGGFTEGNLVVDGRNGREVFLTPLATKWEAEVSATGSMPGFSAVRAEVENRKGVNVHLSKQDWAGMIEASGSRPELGEFALEFSPLEPGYYIVEPEGLDVRADVHLTGLEAVWVSFRQKTAPSNPNVVLPLTIEANQPFEPTSSFVDEYAPARPIKAEALVEDEGGGDSDLRGVGDEPIEIERGAGGAAEPTAADTHINPALGSQNEAPNEVHEPVQYLFISADVPWTGAELAERLTAVLRYVAIAQPEIGSDHEAALAADEVIILGEVDTIFMARLENRGIQVAQVTDRLIEAFKQLYEGR